MFRGDVCFLLNVAHSEKCSPVLYTGRAADPLVDLTCSGWVCTAGARYLHTAATCSDRSVHNRRSCYYSASVNAIVGRAADALQDSNTRSQVLHSCRQSTDWNCSLTPSSTRLNKGVLNLGSFFYFECQF